MTERVPLPMCPMAATCKGIMQKPASGYWMALPGIILVILGVAIIVYPQILAWFVAFALIVMGIAMLMMVRFMRHIGKQYEQSH